jgi:hypothetical protein
MPFHTGIGGLAAKAITVAKQQPWNYTNLQRRSITATIPVSLDVNWRKDESLWSWKTEGNKHSNWREKKRDKQLPEFFFISCSIFLSSVYNDNCSINVFSNDHINKCFPVPLSCSAQIH